MAAPDPAERDAPDPRGVLRAERVFASTVLRRHGWRLLLVFVGLLLPMWGFAELADEVREGEPFAFDAPLLERAHGLAGPGLDRLALWLAALGYRWGVVPVDIALVLVLLGRRHLREATFAGFALAGSALLNIGTKALFARDRPALWDSIGPEFTYSFPSGHAMGSATLAWVLVLLAWHTRWRWPVLAGAGLFALLVGASRVYLGVHYPSDILAGWAAASAWTATCHLAVYRVYRRPWAGAVQS